MQWNNLVFLLPVNIWVGCATALLAAFFDVARQEISVRDKVMIVLLAVGMTGGVVEWFLLQSAPLTCFTTGLIAGRSADSFMKSIDETMPTFSRDVVADVQQIIRNRLKSKANDFRQPENTKNVENEAVEEIIEESPEFSDTPQLFTPPRRVKRPHPRRKKKRK